MSLEQIPIQSAGALSVAVLALFMTVLQALFFFRKTQSTWHAWSAAICFSAMLYAVGIFLEYNTPKGALNRFAGLTEWTALIFLVHSLYGFSFSYLGIKSRRYHLFAGIFHGLLFLMLWTGNMLVADTFAVRHFAGLNAPYIEPDIGPLGPFFVIYVAVSGMVAVAIWLRTEAVARKYRAYYLTGIGVWLLLGIHDGLTALGISPFQYVMEYGFFAFAMAVLWVVFNRYLEIAAEEQYRVITEVANDGILVIQNGRIVLGNPACDKLVGRSLKEATLEDFLSTMALDDRNTALYHYRSLLNAETGKRSHTVSIKMPDGMERILEIVAIRILYWNRPAILAVMRDMTERIREEEDRLAFEKKLARMKKMESLGLLAGGVAHDLNNVLSGIVTYPDLIINDLAPDSPLRKPIKTMQRSGKKAAAIVQDLLTLARRGVATRAVVNLNDVISDYLESPEHANLLSFHPGVTISSRLEKDLFNVAGSFMHLSKTIMNLVSNAAEAMPAGGRITIETRNQRIDGTLRCYESICQGDYALIRISDTGVGITAEERERIFEPFYTKKIMGRSGTGLGMAVVWGTVKDHNGFIDIDSAPSRGTTFTLFLPATREKASLRPPRLPADAYMGRGEKVLVVDDVKAQREIATAILNKIGYRATGVPSGEAALEYLSQNRADLLILDMIMDPGMDGLETYRQILEIHPGQKAVIASGFSETDRVAKAQRLGAGAYLKKPYTLESLGSAIRAELDR